MNYEQDIKIDPNALDIEWLEQGELALKYAKYLSSLRRKVNEAEEEKKTIRSELIIKVNKDPELIGKKSPNAADIEAYYRSNKIYKECVEDLLELQEELEFAELAYQEIAWTRKKSLENLVTLHGQQYFAGPSMPRDISKEWEAKQKAVDNKVASAMRRSRTK